MSDVAALQATHCSAQRIEASLLGPCDLASHLLMRSAKEIRTRSRKFMR
jgi:hypothetical protein